ncbi:hypothetical protein E2562_013070 [Oryza meyeriana var. granulata]|uniref:Uncharacterized protein n=1 Tax=Oryza meyeriana var. granulata TaxID=110450 RepID=A0A6G1DHW0_9ORYZ|nr:hypothetical protein E2562_013070 [Oryza meyeriana var. granulata]
MRGIARLVIVTDPAEFVAESFRRGKPFLKDLMERGVLAVPFPTDGNTPSLQFNETDDDNDGDEAGKIKRRLWQLTPVYLLLSSSYQSKIQMQIHVSHSHIDSCFMQMSC